MLIIHALTFDRRWVASYQPTGSAILFYDGTCGFCNGLVRFSLSEDADKRLKYSPLQGQTFREKGLEPIEDDSIALLMDSGEVLHKSDAAIRCLEFMGGTWLLIGKLMKVFPGFLRDSCYDLIGRIRSRLAGKVDAGTCQLLPGPYKSRMI